MGIARIRTEQVIDVSDWDHLVETTYGRPYSFQQQDGCKSRGREYLTVSLEGYDDYENDSVPDVINGEEMGVSFAAWLARDPKEWNGKEGDERYLDLFWGRNFYPAADAVAHDLCKRGLIEEGEYVIDIDW
uniref:Uncharacterized protein n=2 Tax=unclassified bacterial viruses TaxID=12333 RepID=A0AAU6VYJ6_9VIRU